MASSIKYSYTLWSPADTVRDVAEGLGIVNLPEDVAKALAMDIEYRINEVLEQATKFMKHSKRTSLTTADISNAFRVLNIEPLYGYDSARPLRFREAILGPGQTLYYIDDDEVDFEKIINMPLPKVPREVSFTAHWLAIEGVQPAIPQNPLPAESRTSMATSGNTSAEVEVKPLVKHALSRELQLYFERVVTVLTEDSSNGTMKNAVLNSLGNDPGLHQLIPYFIQFVAEKIRLNLRDASMLYLMLQVLHRLLTNPTIFIEPYIHSVMPPILTLLVGKRLGSSQSSNEDHYQVRDFAASLLQQVCTQYGDTYHTLKPRVTRTLLKAFMDSSKSIGTQYGALSGLRAIGPEVIRVLVLGNLKDWAVVISSASSVTDEDKSRLGKAVLEGLRALIDPEVATMDEVGDSDKEKFKEFVGPEVAKLVFEVDDWEVIVKAVLDSQKFS
ncbi:hypothetical protein POJ06DRAFT_84672 [Lipomyces tetrasporus]|uniref:TBP-associated factor 6 n=1 Tax=Lipomyces tetrasporus TaxID=54092 RepID=A0AAD7VTN9_9ASCO|nr:uncharacterized protein POJ06DRAFT_84672 [Lipomyces tetrasporus]KAJ8100944.1 hypothetical protein POJ06DRAFT_84672 [Lipomyces tetrasporus]